LKYFYYNGTKTEVSADGVNWTVLFDSAVDGTYIESMWWRTHKIQIIEDNWDINYDLDTDEGLDNFLKSLFEEFGIENIEEDGIEINVSWYLLYQRIWKYLNSIKWIHPDILYSLIEKIEKKEESYENSNDELIIAIFQVLISWAYIEVETYWQNNEEERSQEEIQLVRDIGHILGVTNAYDGTKSASKYWYSIIVDDYELESEAKEELLILTDWLTEDLNPVIRLQRLKKVYNLLQNAKKVDKLRNLFKNGNFASWKLDKHYQDHVFNRWEDWPTNITKNEYLNRARSLLSAKPNSNIIEHVNKNWFMFKYNKITNEFATWKPDGTIETLYKPTRWYEYMKEQIIKYP